MSGASYWEKLHELARLAKAYAHLPLEDMIRRSLVESGFDPAMMENVYIDENVSFPHAYGCFAEEDAFTTYIKNENGEKRFNRYADPAAFMMDFVRTAPSCRRWHE